MISTLLLSRKEREVLQLICLDRPTKSIADELGVTERTVYSHLRQLKLKTGSNGVAGLVLFALENLVFIRPPASQRSDSSQRWNKPAA